MFPTHHHHNLPSEQTLTSDEPGPGTKDGIGAGDHDRPYTRRTPHALSPFPFTTRQYVKLLLLRSRVRSGLQAEFGPALSAA